jgi:hypothetical protein
MGENERKVVWILGAGFSVPLGGPLFRKLISGQTLRDLKNWPEFKKQKLLIHYPSENDPDTRFGDHVSAELSASVVCDLYTKGANSSDGMPLWSDAEQFLDQLGIAASEPKGQLATDIRQLLKGLGGAKLGAALQVPEGMDVLHREAIRFVASACSTFLLRAERDPSVVDHSEQWDPYRRWFDQLKPGHDVVITFNYDRSLDILADYRRRVPPKADLLISPAGCERDHFEACLPHCVPVYHLHGHVGWQRSDDGESIAPLPTDSSGFRTHAAKAHEKPERAVIGVPGHHKRTLPEGILKDLWDRAMNAIGAAHAVVFVGYRFPETDNLAKRRLVDALKDNPDTMAHIILGAHNPDLPRLRGMIDWTRWDHDSERARVHDMLAQDFFVVFDRRGLFREKS